MTIGERRRLLHSRPTDTSNYNCQSVISLSASAQRCSLLEDQSSTPQRTKTLPRTNINQIQDIKGRRLEPTELLHHETDWEGTILICLSSLYWPPPFLDSSRLKERRQGERRQEKRDKEKKEKRGAKEREEEETRDMRKETRREKTRREKTRREERRQGERRQGEKRGDKERREETRREERRQGERRQGEKRGDKERREETRREERRKET
ncbi:hypothetical protein WMY93_012664 [Mugilogobius chulae]|uniref:Uncharacterized protein n=1 Tax=Mugilogobius chulae TaxID=88201 RepID=A0AAW0NY32_9GOBI